MIIAPSILAADFANLEREVNRVASETHWLHVDVMDGVFVNNISIGVPVVKSLRKVTSMVLDTHLMISDPDPYIAPFVQAGSDRITFHIETSKDPLKTIQRIKQEGAKVGISLKPDTPVSAIEPYLKDVDLVLVMSVEPGFGGQAFMPEALDKIKTLKALKTALPADYLIEVDGGINAITATLCKEAGADVLVAGSYVFGSENIKKAIGSLR